MPLIDKIGSLKIKIYYGEHFPAHIHASYNEYEALIDIYTGEVLSGELPLKQLKLCLDWLKVNTDLALGLFKAYNPELYETEN